MTSTALSCPNQGIRRATWQSPSALAVAVAEVVLGEFGVALPGRSFSIRSDRLGQRSQRLSRRLIAGLMPCLCSQRRATP
jgi:hypothetical protein